MRVPSKCRPFTRSCPTSCRNRAARAIAAAASAQQTAIITGPAIGACSISRPLDSLLCCMAIFVAAAVLVSLVHTEHAARTGAYDA